MRGVVIVDEASGDQLLAFGECGIAWKEPWRARFRLVILNSTSFEVEKVVLYRELDAEGVLGGWKMCDFGPTFRSSFGGSVLSKEKEPGMTG